MTIRGRLRWRRALVATVGVAVLAAGRAALPADKAGNFALEGGGAAACSAFSAARAAKASNEQARFAGWVDGYLTAVNQINPDTYDVTPWQTTELLLALLENHCKQHPEEKFVAAVNRLVQAIFPERLTARSDTLLVGGRGEAVPIYKEVLRRAQERLAALGYQPGAAEAQYDVAFRSAIASFQKDRKLPTTGLPDQQTLYALFVQQPDDKERQGSARPSARGGGAPARP